ncbi:MAG: hypothetical protein Q7T65_10865 [Thiobacillus sp.]|nr:hypothetical protein [Thiobacillus sp.]
MLFSIHSDAHSAFDFSNLKHGVGQAGRGWLEKGGVLSPTRWRHCGACSRPPL